MKHMLRYGFLAVLAIGIVATAAHASAAGRSGDQVERTAVSYADLNLESAAGRATLQQRIDRAAASVCGPQSTRLAGSVGRAVKGQECFEKARARAMSVIDKRLEAL